MAAGPSKVWVPLALSMASLGVAIGVVALVVAASRQPASPAELTIEEASVTRTSDDPPYTIAAAYPVVSGTTDARVAEDINRLIKNDVDANLRQFVDEAENVEPLPDALGSDYTSTYKAHVINNTFLAIELDVSTYVAGAAHPNSYTMTYNFRLEDGSLVDLVELFNDGSDYLSVIAAAAQNQLAAVEGLDNLAVGASPSEDNYRAWLLADDGITVVFDPYQVGPYAAGPQRATVAYGNLYDLLRADVRSELGL